MQVLKKFGILFLLHLFSGFVVSAQNHENCGSATLEVKAKKDPIEFLHNHILKASASNPVSSEKLPVLVLPKTKAKKEAVAKEVVTTKLNTEKGDKKTLAALKLVNEQAKISIQNKTKKNTEVAVEKPTVGPAAKKPVVVALAAPSNDLVSARTITKNVIVKKEEPSFTNTMMDWLKDKYASMIDVMPNQISNVMLYRFIDEWYGVKYRMGGTSKKGVDCSAFVQTLYKYVFGMDLLRTACLQFNSAEIIKNPADLKEGDLVFFRVNTSRISHVGVYLSNNFFVHSASSKGVSIAKLTNAYWAKFFAGGGRIQRKS